MMATATTVVNVKVKNIRPQYQNLNDWMADPNNVYIGRAGVVFIDGVRCPNKASIWANPFKIDKDGTREECLTKYRGYMMARLMNEPGLIQKLLALQGHRLGCWCHPEPCHGNVLIDLINMYSLD